nr:hypothetical protein CFP56_55975 [Quercus suber]
MTEVPRCWRSGESECVEHCRQVLVVVLLPRKSNNNKLPCGDVGAGCHDEDETTGCAMLDQGIAEEIPTVLSRQ